MKLITAIAAALAAAVSLPALAAPQERTVVRERTVEPAARTTRVVTRESTSTRRDYGYRRHARRVCAVRYRHGQRVRTCRTVRY